MTQKYNHTNFQYYLLVKVLMICNVTPRFRSILEKTTLALQQAAPPSYLNSLALKEHQILKKYLFSDAKAENGLSFDDLSSGNCPTSGVNYNISYFFVYLQ